MGFTKIVTNTTINPITRLGVILQPSIAYEIPKESFAEWSVNAQVVSDIENGDIIVNNGVEDLSVQLALAHIDSGISFVHEDVSLLPAIGLDSPELIRLCPTTIGYNMEIGNEIFAQTRIDKLVGDFVQIQIHYTINNNESDKWVQFDVSYFTTDGRSDLKQVNTPDGTVTIGPDEVETSPYLVRESVVNIPTTAFNSDENYLFLGIKRVAPTAKNSPTNNPIALRYCKRYYKIGD